MAEIAKADDWGLVASAFELPQLAQGEASPAALAAAEIKLGLAVLKYARHARGGRLDPAALSKHLDMKPTLREPKAVLEAVVATDTPGTTCASCIPSTSSSSACARPCSRRVAAAAQREPAEPASAEPHGPAAGRPAAQARLGAPHVALLRQRLGVPAARRGEDFRSRAAGRAQDLPGPQQHPDLGPADAAHARRPQWRRAEAASRRPGPCSRGPRSSG